MSLREAIAYALEVDDPAQPAIVPASGPRSPLTGRERQVAALIAHGKTNRQIAAELVITELTAETHVRNILRKLDFTSRAQVAVWVAEGGAWS